MLDPKFQIPRVMVGGLALGGVVAGCGGSDGPTEPELIARLCTAMENCDPDEFDYDYDSQAECRQSLSDYLDYAEEEYGARCRRAIVAYYSCALPEYELTCDDADCDAEYAALVNACGD